MVPVNKNSVTHDITSLKYVYEDLGPPVEQWYNSLWLNIISDENLQ